ncbi:MAG: cation:proton antiporter [Pseudomonadota bacterium]
MASPANSEFLLETLTYLGAAAGVVSVFNRLKLGSILGFVAAGVIIGPDALGLLQPGEGVFEIAEFGVVLFLFVIGLELSLSRLWSMRTQIIGLGFTQVAATGALITGVLFFLTEMSVAAAAIGGVALAFSSTAFVLQLLRERGELNTGYGRRAFAVLLFQDIAVVPLLAAIPLAAGAVGGGGWTGVAKAIVALGAVILVGRYGLDRLFRIVAISGSREAFAATALFIVAATATAVSWAGLSMALGAFLAGVMLAESTYRHQIAADIEPFRGLLLGLFFISIGLRLDLDVVVATLPVVLGGAIALILAKAGLIAALARAFGASNKEAVRTGLLLSQGGEFAFVAFTLGLQSALFSTAEVSVLNAMVTLSMVATPLALLLVNAVLRDRSRGEDAAGDTDARGEAGHVLIVGFGRMGQIISQVLKASGVGVTALDRNPEHIRNAQRFGYEVYFGDGARLDTLLAAGASDARAIIFCIDDQEATNHAVSALKARFPSLPLLVVAHDRLHEIALQPLEPDFIVRETLESSLLVARETLSRLGFAQETIEDYVAQFRSIDRERLLAQMDAGPEAGRDALQRRFRDDAL